MRENNNLVVKSNKIIEARYHTTALEAKIIAKLVTAIHKDDDKFEKYDFAVKKLLNEFNIGGENYLELKIAVRRLLTKLIIIKEHDKILETTFLSSAEYYDKEGKVSLMFDPRLKPYLLQLKDNFTTYQLESIIKISSFYSIRIYELLKQYEKIGYRIFKIEKLREILGISPEQYKLYNDFKKRVILQSQKDLKKDTDIYFDFEEIKEGRKVVAIKFIIKKNIKNLLKDNKKEVNQSNEILEDIFNILPDEQKEKQTILEIISEWQREKGDEYVIQNIKYTNKNYKKNYRSYLVKSLNENWGEAMREDEQAEKKIREERLKIEREKEKKEKLKKAKIEKEKKIDEEVTEHIKSLPAEEQKQLEIQAFEMLENEVKERIRKGNPLAKMRLETEVKKIVMHEIHP